MPSNLVLHCRYCQNTLLQENIFIFDHEIAYSYETLRPENYILLPSYRSSRILLLIFINNFWEKMLLHIRQEFEIFPFLKQTILASLISFQISNYTPLRSTDLHGLPFKFVKLQIRVNGKGILLAFRIGTSKKATATNKV